MLRHVDKRFLHFNVLAMAIASALLLVIASATLVMTERTKRDANAGFLIEDLDRRMMTLVSILSEAESGQRGYLITRDESYLEPFQDARDRYWREFDTFSKRLATLPDGVNLPDVDLMRVIAERKFTEMDHTIRLARDGRFSDAMAIVGTDEGRALMEQAGALAAEFARVATDLRQRRVEATRDGVESLTNLTLAAVALLITLVGVGIYVVLRHTKEIEVAKKALADANLALAATNVELEHRVHERTQGLVRANEEVQRYAYIVSHDLRAPLVNIMGFTGEIETATSTFKTFVDRATGTDPIPPDEWLKDEVRRAVEEDIPEALGFIRTSMIRMDGLINEILKLSRLGRRQLTPEPIDTDALVGAAIETMRHRLDEVSATAVIEGSLPPLVSDRPALERIFTNLLDNAVKYLDCDRQGKIIVRGRRFGDMVEFEVEDNGRGVPPKDHERIFELFRRAGTQNTIGEGIGLTHVRSITRRLNGDIVVESDGRSGSTFRVTMAADLRDVLRDDSRAAAGSDTRAWEAPNTW